MLKKSTFEFLRNLESNNNRDWFQANKAEYDQAVKNFADFVNELIKRISVFDTALIGVDAKQSVFRIFRDVRFSKDKSPYKTNFGAFMAPGGRKSGLPGYYIHLDAWDSFLAGGSWCPEPEALLKTRNKIAEETDKFFSIIRDSEFNKAFGDLSPVDQKLVNVPKGFPKEHEAAEYLKYKNYIASRKIKQSDFSKLDFMEKQFQLMTPLNLFLRNALRDG